ncbi:hypothetical protein [Acidisphaera sp. L21]|uniref:hypothetical protein n=1 Tax=Acidisphaera sp. L21 TaxID=1641851 RepID=UPI00131C9FDE|nr:hypothetical protein [Acidisphaera sp. L21]
MLTQPKPTDAKVREVVAGLAQARDAQIARVVAMVDDMPDRGQADSLIAPLRGRLAQIRPARPFTVTRLLFSPLDSVIIAGTRWRRGEVGIPRQALSALGNAVQAALPRLAEMLEPDACRVAPDDRRAIATLGGALWSTAAEAMQGMRAPPDWAETSGLKDADFTQLVGVIAAILAEASEIEDLALSRAAPGDAAIRAVLSRTEPRGALAMTTLVSVLLARLPVPSRVLALAAEMPSHARSPATDRAMDHTLASLQASMADGAADNGDATEAAIEAARVASLLTGLEETAHTNPERRRRLEQIRREADALCRRRFDRAMASATSQAAVAVTIEGGDEALGAMEATARDLRRLESAGRRLGSGEHYDALMQSLSAQFRDHTNGLGLADRVRLVEILSGPDEALALLLSQ